MLPDLDYDVINKVPLTRFDGVGNSKLYLVHKMDEWDAFYKLLMQQKKVACDTETTGFRYYSGDKIVGLSFGWNDTHFYIPVRHESSVSGGQVLPQLKMEDIKEDLRTFFSQQDVIILGHNWKFDQHFYKADGIDILCPFHDTSILWKLTNENAPVALKRIASGWRDDMGRWHKGLVHKAANDQEKRISDWRGGEAKARRDVFKSEVMARADLAQTKIEYQGVKRAELKKLIIETELKDHPYREAKKEDIHYGVVPIDLMCEYAGLDTFLTWKVYEHTYPQIKADKKLSKLYLNELALSKALFDAEETGIDMNVPYLHEINEKWEEDIASLERSLTTEERLGNINLNSTDQLALAFKNKLGANLTKQTESGKLAMDKDVLRSLSETYDEAKDLLRLRELNKLKNTYVEGILDKLGTSTVLHAGFNQNVSTGRMSSTDPNCFTGDTEVLTPEGWVPFHLYKKGTKVAQWASGTLSFVEPSGYTCAKKRILEIETRAIKLAVTPDHRCLLRSRGNEDRVVPAIEYPEDHKQLHAAVLPGSVHLSEELITLVCAIQADSYLCGSMYELSFKKKRKITKLRRVLHSLHLSFSERIDSLGRTRFKIPLSKETELLGGKFFSIQRILELDISSRKALCKEVMFWDGCWSRRNHYSSNCKENAVAVQTAFVTSGFRARMREYQGSKNINYQVDVVWDKDYSWTTNRVVTECREQLVYCVSVPSSFLMVRRQGCVVITGNCQNIPSRGDAGDAIRRAFICPKDYIYVFADYSQVEVRLTAHFSQDPLMLDAYEKNQDIHLRTACEMFDIPIEDGILIYSNPDHPRHKEIKNYRTVSKIINFGIIYGVGAPGLAGQIPRPEQYKALEHSDWVQICQSYIDAYLYKYRGVKRFIIIGNREVRRYHKITNHFGRIRHLPHAEACKIYKDKSYSWLEARAQRQGVNFVVQGTAADVFKFAVVRVHKLLQGTKSRAVNFVHDEIQIYLHKDEFDLLYDIKREMEDFDFTVPLLVDFEFSDSSWADKKEMSIEEARKCYL